MVGNTNKQWFVAYTKPAKEEIAKHNLQNQKFLVEMPLYKSIKLTRGKWQQKIEPMFPRYIFYQPPNQNHSIRSVRSTIGIIKTIAFGNQPAIISDLYLQSILNISNQQMNADIDNLIPFSTGNTVGIISGSFAGIEGIVSNIAKRRISVLIQILGQEKSIDFDFQELKII